MGAHEFLELADGGVLAQGHVAEEALFVVGFEAEKDFGVADGEALLCDVRADFGGEIEEADGVGDRGAAASDARGDFLLGEGELAGEAGVGLGLLDGVEIGALEVFDERELEDLSVGSLADDGGRVGEAEACGGAPAALAGDELVTRAGRGFPEDERLDDALGPDGLDQLVEVGLAEFLARLERAGSDLGEGDAEDSLSRRGVGDGGGHRGGGAGVEKGAQSFA